MAIFQKLTLLLHPNLHLFLFDLVTTGFVVVMLVMVFFFAWTLMEYVNDAMEKSIFEKSRVELLEPEKRAWPDNPPQMRNDRKTLILPSSAVDKFRRDSAHLEKNGGNYASTFILEKKHLYLLRTINQFKKINSSLEEHGGKNIHEGKCSYFLRNVDQYKGKFSSLEENIRKNVHKRKNDSLLRIEELKQIKERKKNSMYNVKVLELKQKKKRWLATSYDIELDGYPSSKRLKVDKDVNDTTSCSKNIVEEKCERRVEEVPDYMEVEQNYMEPEPDYMEVDPMNHLDMLMDSVTRLMNSLSIVEYAHSDMSIDDLENLTMDLNLVEELNQKNFRMDMSVDDIQNLMTGLSLMEHSDHTIDMCIEDITNLMKVLSLTAIRRECFYIET